MKMLQTARQRLEYLAILLPYRLIRLLPYRMIRLLGRLFGAGMHLVPGIRDLVRANIHAAMPELPPEEVARIGRESLFHMAFNLLEFIWLNGNTWAGVNWPRWACAAWRTAWPLRMMRCAVVATICRKLITTSTAKTLLAHGAKALESTARQQRDFYKSPS